MITERLERGFEKIKDYLLEWAIETAKEDLHLIEDPSAEKKKEVGFYTHENEILKEKNCNI